MSYALVAVALTLAALRLNGATGPAFQAAAHLFVGGLLGAGLASGWGAGRAYFALAAALTVVEVGAFLLKSGG